MPQHLELLTLADGLLAIGRYPPFRYDGRGGGGPGRLASAAAEGRWRLHFDAARLRIPPLDWRSTRFLGLPLPPGLAITITPDHLGGEWLGAEGELRLQLRARFQFSIAGLYRAPELLIETELSSAGVQGRRHRAEGSGLEGGLEGEAHLAGVAWVEPTGEAWLDRFLGLPDEALAQLRCRLVVGGDGAVQRPTVQQA